MTTHDNAIHFVIRTLNNDDGCLLFMSTAGQEDGMGKLIIVNRMSLMLGLSLVTVSMVCIVNGLGSIECIR